MVIELALILVSSYIFLGCMFLINMPLYYKQMIMSWGNFVISLILWPCILCALLVNYFFHGKV
jgi:hypothetical protein